MYLGENTEKTSNNIKLKETVLVTRNRFNWLMVQWANTVATWSEAWALGACTRDRGFKSC